MLRQFSGAQDAGGNDMQVCAFTRPTLLDLTVL